MTDPRRYDDDEIREIFERATELEVPGRLPAGSSAGGESTGMTLSQIQEIGVEAGIDPQLVARAAAGLETSAADAVPTLRHFGIPISVGRVVDLPARLTDEQWDRLVVRLRDLFRARGTVTHEGSLRSWSNGNLQVLLEPTREGYRLRMRSLSNSIRGRLTAGGIMLLMTVVLAGLAILGGGGVSEVLTILLLIGGGGSALFGSGLFDSRRWIVTRDEQFREIGAMAWEMASQGAAERTLPEPPADGSGDD